MQAQSFVRQELSKLGILMWHLQEHASKQYMQWQMEQIKSSHAFWLMSTRHVLSVSANSPDSTATTAYKSNLNMQPLFLVS